MAHSDFPVIIHKAPWSSSPVRFSWCRSMHACFVCPWGRYCECAHPLRILCGCAWLDWPMSSTAIGLGEPVWSLKQQCPIWRKETIRNGSRAWQLRPWGIYVGERDTLELWPAHSMASVNSPQRTCFHIPVRFDWYLKIVRKELTGLSTIVLFCHCSLLQP